MFRTIAAAVALSCVVTANPALANEIVKKVQGRVSYAGLDLSDPSDVAELKERIDRKAKRLCTRGLHKELWDSPEVKACRASVLASCKGELAKLIGGQSVHHRVALSN